MKVGLIHHTEDYHKLVEMTARECYQSYQKLNDESHNFIKGIMAAGHISVASTGNIVFGIASFTGLEEYLGVMSDLMTMKEINNYIRWTFPDPKKNPDSKIGVVVSMNMLTFLDLHKNIEEYDTNTNLFESFKTLINRVPELRWFIDDKTKLEPRENQYTSKGEPELYKPVILAEDYTALKEKGLTEYELNMHATVTLNLKVDRATGLQIWRHADMAGGTELSQRYVDRSTAEYRKILGFEKGKYPENLKEKYIVSTGESEGVAKAAYDGLVDKVYSHIEDSISNYTELRDRLIDFGVRQGRAKEIARSMLPNAMTTKIISCRPLRQWKHFFNLRDTNHAQKEIKADAQSIKKALEEAGVRYE
ncbi:FAD-dependent thymidylate synthase [Bacillus licheniformis]|uniref:FAD-dependent thymidylate synthase n=1 Tax=Bacillus licheniformis TaxID=1402 RepID=UPI0020C91191|nr:FAD-dependent thymidylate synthase [Bacillus licheniformis]MCP8973146.1 FAD-dependent thymidylate synthase [Bacillus licheniformis]